MNLWVPANHLICMKKCAKKLVGKFSLGTHRVLVYLDFSTCSGSFSFGFSSKTDPHIEVGADQDWKYVVSVLTHEAVEAAFMAVGARFRPAPDFGNSSDGYVFHADHFLFGEATARAGEFLADCLPDVEKIYKKHKPKK